jgi:hypothetical protein
MCWQAPLLAPVASFQRTAGGPPLSEKRDLRTSAPVNWNAVGRNRRDAQCHRCPLGFIHWASLQAQLRQQAATTNIGMPIRQSGDSLPLSPLLCRFTVAMTL